MGDLSFELVTFVPWTEDEFEDEPIYSSALGPGGSPNVLGHFCPDLLLGADGTLWLAKRGDAAQVVRIREADSPQVFALDAAGMETVTALAPTLDAGLLLFGREGSDLVLARLSQTGEVVWRRTDLSLPTEFDRAELLSDWDGSIYLYLAIRREGPMDGGQILRIDLDEGRMTTITEFVDWPPKRVWVGKGSLFWVVYSDGSRSWVSHDMETGSQQTVEVAESLQPVLGMARAPLPQGGALLGVPTDLQLIWMGPDGEPVDRLALAGIVRLGERLAVGVQEGDETVVTYWNGGQKTDASPPIPESQLREAGGVSVVKTAVESDGRVLLVGSDPEGAYVVRITNGQVD